MFSLLTSIGEWLSVWRYTKLLFISIALLMSFFIWQTYFHKNADAVKYLTANVVRSDIQSLVTATGILQPHDYVDVGAQVSGQLKKLHVEIGSRVKAGDLLAEIDATVYRARVEGIRAQLDNLKAQLGDREATLKLARLHLEKQQKLMATHAISIDTLQTTEAAYQSAEALYKSLQAQIRQSEYSLRVEDANLTYAKIYAPIDGTVVTITSRQGQTLNANQQAPTIMRIADLSTMTVQTQVSEADIGKLWIDMPVYFTTLGGKDYRWYSKLDRIEPTPEVTNNVVLYNALFSIPNDANVLMSKMNAQVYFIAASTSDALVIPASAINFNPQNNVAVDGSKRGENSWGGEKKSAWRDKHVTAQDRSQNSSTSSSIESNTENRPATVGNTMTTQSDQRDEHNGENKSWKRNTLPIAQKEVIPQQAVVQVMDKLGNLSSRTITIGISNRVQVQVLNGLKEGELVVASLRQQEKASNGVNNAQTMGPAAGAARQFR